MPEADQEAGAPAPAAPTPGTPVAAAPAPQAPAPAGPPRGTFSRLLGFVGFGGARKDRDLSLDAIRGVAILMAVGWHFNRPTGNVVLDALLAPGRTIGWSGVDLFYVLSGFLIGKIILAECNRTGTFQARRFFVRRMLRLWPILYLFLVVQLVAGQHPWRTFLVQNACHVQNYTGSSLDHLWSLAVEEHFYLVIGLGLPLWLRRRPTPGAMIGAVVAIMVAAPLLRLLAVAAHWEPLAIATQTQFRMDALAGGVLLALLSVYRPQAFAALAQRKAWLASAVAAGCTALAVMDPHGAAWNVIGLTVAYLSGMAFLLLLFKSAVMRVTWLSQPLAFLGIYSYSLYIWQMVGVRFAPKLTAMLHLEGSVTSEVLSAYVIALVTAIAMSTLIERPVMFVRDLVFVRKEAPAAVFS